MNDFSLPQLATVQELYESARFLDAWRLTEPLWQDRQLAQRLSADELIMAGRLAGRLGSGKLYRALMRLALERAPDSPRVRYYARAAAGRRMSLFELFCIMEDEAPAKFDDPDLAASW